jgi:hypothetical protein
VPDAEAQAADEKFPRRRRPPCLKTARHVERELARLYWRLMQGEVTAEIASTGGRLLHWIIRAKEVGDFEERLVELEKLADETPNT